MTTEGSVLSWSIFFCGCKRIANMVHQPNKTYDGDWALILDWVFYHDAMYKFSICHFVQRIPDQVALARDAKIVSKAVFSPQRHVVSCMNAPQDRNANLQMGFARFYRRWAVRLRCWTFSAKSSTPSATGTTPPTNHPSTRPNSASWNSVSSA